MRYNIKLLILLLTIALATSCNFQKKDTEETKWSVQFADAVMTRSDSLIYYQREVPKYEYDFALLASAINKLGNMDSKYSDYAKAYIDYFVQEDGSINGYKLRDYNLDRVRPGLNMLKLYQQTGDEKYKKAIEVLVSQIETQPRTEAGGFWHKKAYPYQMWLDGIYMASPFLANYAKAFDQPQWFDEVTFQMKLIYEKTRDPETGLLYHAWDESRQQQWCNPETGQSKHFWSRAEGWYTMALVDVLEVLPENHKNRAGLIQNLQNLSEALLKVKDPETGLWYQVLDEGGREGNYLEASGSAMFIYAFAKAAKNGYLNKKYLKIASDSFDAMIKNMVVTGDDGLPTLTNTCGACGLGGNPYRAGDYAYYISEKRVDNDSKGVGPFILAAIELDK